MAQEIERKFLVEKAKLPPLGRGIVITQGYIPTKNKTTVRVRYTDQCSYLTIKGPANGISRLEFEYPIPNADAKILLQEMCFVPYIDKTRYNVECLGHVWEIDYFHGLNDGLIVAEVELQDETEPLELPAWVTAEVSCDPNYTNANLCRRPFSEWSASLA